MISGMDKKQLKAVEKLVNKAINCEEFIKDVERHGVPVEYYFMKKCKER